MRRGHGLPAGDFPLSIFDTVLRGLTVRGSIVGSRLDMAQAIDFYLRGTVATEYETRPLAAINDIFTMRETGTIDGRIVMDLRM